MQRLDAVLERRSGRRALEHLCRPRRHPLLPAAERAAAQRLLRPGRHRRQGRGGARAAARRAREVLLAEEFPRPSPRVYPLELGPPVGWPVQYRVSGPDVGQGARRSPSASPRRWPRTATRAGSISTGSSRPAQLRVRIDQDQARLLGLSSAGARRRAQHRHHRHAGDPGARRHLPGQRGGPRHRRAARLARHAAQPAGPAAGRAHGRRSASSPASSYEQEFPLIWRRDRVPTLTVQADVAPGSLPEAVVARARARPSTRIAAGLPPGYRIERRRHRSRRAPASQASVLAVVPVMLVIMLTVLMVQLQSFQRLVLVVAIAAARPDRRGRRAAAVPPAARLRRHPRHPRADRHDRQERASS